ncbi:pyruvate formate lyase family protein, partial [Chloroflexota bacterium]
HAAELLACFLIKCGAMHRFWSGKEFMTAIEGAHQIKAVVGGVDQDGNDATNELSYMLLHVAGHVKLHEPAFYARWHQGCPREFMIKAAWSQREHGGGSPAFHNDEHTIPCLIDLGASIEDARDYHIEGCSHPFPHGAAYLRAHPQINGAKIFELVLYNGFDPRSKKQLGLKTGDPRTFTGIEDWIEAWKKQWEYLYGVLNTVSRVGKNSQLECYDLPFASAMSVDCIKNGRTMAKGGCRYPQFLQNPGIRVYADVADSLTAINKLVYESKKLTIDEIMEACASDFEGEKGERIRDILRAAPKYGNDNGEPDGMYRRLQDWVVKLVRSSKGYLGFNRHYQGLGAALHFRHGLYTGALPNGHKAGHPLADGAISPVSGCDTSGLTATLASAGKLLDWNLVNSAIFNQKMPKSLLTTREKLERFVDLIETFFEHYNPYQIQWNIQDAAVYKLAKENPQDYKDLIVRVGGYSAYFVELAPILQDEIITRTEQGL